VANERRRDYTVSKAVHTLYMVVWVTSLLLVGAFLIMVYTFLRLGYAKQVPDVLGANPFVYVGLLAFVIVCAALALGVYSIVHTHRLLGSAYRIGVVLREANEGKETKVVLRDGDFFIDIGSEINLLIDRARASGPAAPARTEASTPPT
jgi:hypothetical protein